jgi:hypothetical protein
MSSAWTERCSLQLIRTDRTTEHKDDESDNLPKIYGAGRFLDKLSLLLILVKVWRYTALRYETLQHTPSASDSQALQQSAFDIASSTMIPRKPTTIALRAEDIQDLHEQIAEREAREASKQEASSSAATEKPAKEQNTATTEGSAAAGVPETTLDTRKGKSRKERLGL